MPFIIKRPEFRHPLHSHASKGMVINEYTGEPKRFDTREAAVSYSKLSCFSGAKITSVSRIDY